jgi:flagellar basal-body rod modification protein FlgD
MPDPVIGAVGGSPAYQPATTDAATRRDPVKDLGKDTFLKLLVAQMRYQDPTKPTDNSQFLAQTAQFTTVEKMSEIAKSQADALAVQLRLSASNLVGRTITYPGPDGAELTGVVTSATFTGSSPTLKVGNTDVPLSSVREVRHNADPSAPSNP